jgi:hypothetical protein
MSTWFCRSAVDRAVFVRALTRSFRPLARPPLTACPFSPRCRISLPSDGSRQGLMLRKSEVSCHCKQSGWGSFASILPGLLPCRLSTIADNQRSNEPLSLLCVPSAKDRCNCRSPSLGPLATNPQNSQEAYHNFPGMDAPCRSLSSPLRSRSQRNVSLMNYDLGYETCRLEPLANPFGPKVLPMSSV